MEQKIYTAEFNNMHKIYFLKLWKKNKFFFLAVFLFFLINIVANLFIVTQITPIYNWSLYSAPIENQQTYSFLKVIYNDNKVLRFKHTWEDPRKFLLTNTMKLFVADEKELNKFPLHFPTSTLTNLYKFLIVRPYILNIGAIFIFLIEGLMIIGFFTRKFDHILLFIPIIIHIATYFFADVFFIDMLIGVFTFFSANQILKVKSLLPIIAK